MENCLSVCAVIETWTTSFQPEKMPGENRRHSRVFSGIFPVEMVSFKFFCKITKVFSNFRKVIHVSILRENKARPIRACVGRVLFYEYTHTYIYICVCVCVDIYIYIYRLIRKTTNIHFDNMFCFFDNKISSYCTFLI